MPCSTGGSGGTSIDWGSSVKKGFEAIKGEPDIGEFELRDMDAGDLLGIFMGVHSLPGVIMLLHTTVGCKFKTQLQISDHDWGRESHNQRLWTGVDDARIIKGSGERLLEFATTWYQRRRPELFVVVTNASVELSAFDVEASVRELAMRLPIPVVYLKAPGHDGSIFSGFERFTAAMVPFLDSPDLSEGNLNSVALAGYFLDRFEMEHAANVAEIRRLLGGLGLALRGTLFDGSPFDKVRRAGAAANMIWLPYARGVPETACIGDGRRHCVTDLPVGLTGTTEFLRNVGRAFGLDQAAVERVCDRELARAVPIVRRAVNSLSGVRVAVFLDTNLAAGVTSFLTEIGCDVPVVFLTDGGSASSEEFMAACTRLGAPFADSARAVPGVGRNSPRVVAGASRNRQYLEFIDECEREFIPIVVGSSLQKAAFRRGDIRVIEMGFPCAEKHWLYPMPWMGYNGAVALVQRLLDAFMRAW